ncbi:MAG: hypothetical protein ACREAU_00030 [Nitrosopumilaceae archaeon]
MPFRQFIVNHLIGTKLFEMAFSQKEAIRDINVMGRPIIELFLKIEYLNSPNDFNHWLTNLDRHFRALQRIKLSATNTYPTPDQYYQWLLFGREEWDEGSVSREFFALIGPHGRYNTLKLRKMFNPTEAWLDIQHLLNPKISNLFNDMSEGKFTAIHNYLQV